MTNAATFTVDRAIIHVFESKASLGSAAAARAANMLRSALSARGRSRLVLGTGNSQEELIASLAATTDLDWSRIELFHLDEYVGISADHPASFRRWLRSRVVDAVHPGIVHYINGDAPDPEAEARRYADLLGAAPIDLCLIGFGENGHIAFNDPHAADFADPLAVKRVILDEACRRQQVGEGHFPDVGSVPPQAITLTCPTILSAAGLICCVPDKRKARAVQRALEGEITRECPASAVRMHPNASVYLDRDSASLLEGFTRPA
jgi:glucosamine-6-phosphate deaminase